MFLLVGHDLDESDAGGVVDADVDELPAEPLAARAPVALTFAVAGDAVADAVDPAELFDVEVDQLAGMLALIAAHRRYELEGLELVEPQAPQDAADGGWRNADVCRDLLAGEALAPQRGELLDDRLGCRPMQTVWA